MQDWVEQESTVDDTRSSTVDSATDSGTDSATRGASAAGGAEVGAEVGPDKGADKDAELERVRKELEERTADLQRVSAEYANYRRRVERDRESVAAAAKAQVADELLTVLDDVDRAAAHGDLTGPFKVVAGHLTDTLHHVGLAPFGAEGDAFDPTVHEAVAHDTSAAVSEPTVTAVMRRGYRFGERVLRPAMVAVSEPATDAEPAPGGAELGPVDGAGGVTAETVAPEAAADGREHDMADPDVAEPPTAGGNGAAGHASDTRRSSDGW